MCIILRIYEIISFGKNNQYEKEKLEQYSLILKYEYKYISLHKKKAGKRLEKEFYLL